MRRFDLGLFAIEHRWSRRDHQRPVRRIIPELRGNSFHPDGWPGDLSACAGKDSAPKYLKNLELYRKRFTLSRWTIE